MVSGQQLLRSDGQPHLVIARWTNVDADLCAQAFRANRQSAAWRKAHATEFTALWTRILDQTCGVNSVPMNDAYRPLNETPIKDRALVRFGRAL
jgi:hypothetical protein